jgi:hypothetical protein
MNTIWHPILFPVAAAAATGMALVVLLAWYVSLRRGIWRLKTEVAANAENVEKFVSLTDEINALRTRVEEIEQRRGPIAEWTSEPASVHLNRRGQVLRLYRRGEPPSEIASCLGLSHGEVKLIIKIHEMARKEPSPENFPAGALISDKNAR